MDVKQTAEQHAMNWGANGEGIPEMVADAIEKERERCAQIAEHLNGWGSPRAPDLAAHIAKCIRNQK